VPPGWTSLSLFTAPARASGSRDPILKRVDGLPTPELLMSPRVPASLCLCLSGAVVIAFVVCWLPYHVRRLMFCYISDEQWTP
jgi:hypothetical protein